MIRIMSRSILFSDSIFPSVAMGKSLPDPPGGQQSWEGGL